MPSRPLAVAALLVLACAGMASADDPLALAVPAPQPVELPGGPPRLTLVLSGGGARGIAHIGALRALEEAGIPVDAIAANSMGAIVGAVYATGRSADELEQTVLSVDWSSMFSGRPDRRMVPLARRHDRFRTFAGADFSWSELELGPGLLAEHRINRFLIEQLAPAGYAAGTDFNQLPIPFRCVATALETGEQVILSSGDLPLAVRASMSIPVALPPVHWEGRRLVDGLVVDNLPVDVGKQFGAPVLVAVDIGTPLQEPEDVRSSLEIATQVMDLLTVRRNQDFAAEADVLVKPDLGDHSSGDYSGFEPLIEAGYAAMKAKIPEIREKLAAAGHGGALEPRTLFGPRRVLEGATIAEVVVRGNDRLSTRVIRRSFNIPIGPGFILERSLWAFDKAEATGLLEHAWMQFEPVPEGLRIALVVREAPPNRADIGAAFTEWEKARGVLRFRNRNTFGFGEETSLLLVASEANLGGTLGLRGDMPFFDRLGYSADVYLMSDKPRFFTEEGEKINRADFQRRGANLALQAPLDRWGLLEAGLRLGKVLTRKKAGIELPEAEDSVRIFFAGVVVDDMNRLLWPDSGQRLAVYGWWNADEMGATRPFWRIEGEGRLGQRLTKKVVLQLDALVGISGKDLPVYDWFRVGGPYLIPGYHHEELKGPQALAGAVSLRRQITGHLHAVGRVGAGNVYDTRTDITLDDLRWGIGVGVVYQSRFGPLAFELGWRDGGASLMSASFGWN